MPRLWESWFPVGLQWFLYKLASSGSCTTTLTCAILVDRRSCASWFRPLPTPQSWAACRMLGTLSGCSLNPKPCGTAMGQGCLGCRSLARSSGGTIKLGLGYRIKGNSIHTCAYICIDMYTYIYIYISKYVYTHTYIYIYMYTHTYIYIYMYTQYTYIYTHAYIHTYESASKLLVHAAVFELARPLSFSEEFA